MDSGLPIVEELCPPPDPEGAFRRLCGRPHVLFLDSALRHPQLGRHSFLTADPFEYLELPIELASLDRLEERLALYSEDTIAGLPPFQGGAAGLLSYDLGRSLERLPAPRFDEFAAPALAVGLYDTVLAWDHAAGRAWLISQGFPETEPVARQRRARDRIAQFQTWLAAEAPPVAEAASFGSSAADSPIRQAGSLPHDPVAEAASFGSSADDSRSRQAGSLPHDPVAEAASFGSSAADSPIRQAGSLPHLAPQFAVSGPEGLLSNFSAEGYRRAVARIVEYIYAGDVFQVNLAQRLLYPAAGDSVSLYLRLRRCNPAPFAGYFDLGPMQIASASPERFVAVRDRQVEARPIKGTRQRSPHPEADLFAGDDLKHSEKDRAENVMIVDLLRNDLSRVCTPESVKVTELCRLETYQYVQHLVSAVRGELAAGRTSLDLVRAAFPGGSITGAPKVRAMQIIAELEPTARGPYCGSLGYLGFDGALDLSILIRTISTARGWWQMPVGGGIVALSDPQREYEETWHKAQGLLQALR